MPASDPATRMRRIDAEQAEDDDLVAAIAEGDRTAFSVLFGRTQRTVFRFALHMTGSTATADDLTQDVFLTVMRQAARYEKGRLGVTAWLCGIARNYARRTRASERRLTPLDRDAGERRGDSVELVDPVEDLARAQRIDAVRRAVLRLPFRYREVVVMCDLQEMSYGDAAAAIGCAVGTIRSRLHRGRALLAEKLTGIERPPESVAARGSTCVA
jgi:RNA polymerase sigma-70 factor (ECF subfamily)